MPSDRQRRGPVEDADIVHAEEAAFEDVEAARVLAVHPPGEIEQQLGEDALEKLAVALAVALLLRLVEAQRRPGLHGRIDVAEVPFVGRQLPVGVHVPGTGRAGSADAWRPPDRDRPASPDERPSPRPRTRETPICPASRRRLPWWHEPTRCCVPCGGRSGGLGSRRIAVQPLRDVVVEILLRPKDAGESLALNAAEVLVQHLALQLGVEGVRLGFAQAEDLLEIGEGCGLGRTQAQPDAGW